MTDCSEYIIDSTPFLPNEMWLAIIGAGCNHSDTVLRSVSRALRTLVREVRGGTFWCIPPASPFLSEESIKTKPGSTLFWRIPTSPFLSEESIRTKPELNLLAIQQRTTPYGCRLCLRDKEFIAKFVVVRAVRGEWFKRCWYLDDNQRFYADDMSVFTDRLIRRRADTIAFTFH